MAKSSSVILVHGTTAPDNPPAGKVALYFDGDLDLRRMSPDGSSASVCGSPGGHQMMLVTEKYPVGTAAGASVTNTIIYRTLNTLEHNGIAGASLAGSIITLPPGLYMWESWCPGHQCGFHTTWVFDVSADPWVDVLESNVNTAGTGTVTHSHILGHLMVETTTGFRIGHKCQTGHSDGLGSPSNLSWSYEKYSEVIVTRLG